MLIYEWTPITSLSSLRLPAGKARLSLSLSLSRSKFISDSGFVFDRSKTLILSVIYRKEKRVHKEQSGVTLTISTQS